MIPLPMPKRGNAPIQGELLQGTLDLLILKTLAVGAAHGHTIAHAIEHRSEDVLQVEHGSLYPALHRLRAEGWIDAEWKVSEKNQRARYYRLTAKGKKRLAAEDCARSNLLPIERPVVSHFPSLPTTSHSLAQVQGTHFLQRRSCP